MTHGVTERTAGLDYANQSGALNESFSDVMGELIQQWHADPKAFATPEYAAKQDWLIGESVFTPGTKGDALRSMKAPGTAYPRDPQPADMAHYVQTDEDNGGVHVNSGIPNRAAYEAAIKLGDEKVAKVWYKALTEHLQATAQFQDAANATVLSAQELYPNGSEAQAVRDAWAAVGITPGATHAPGTGLTPAAPSGARNSGIVPEWLRVQGASAMPGA
jgi:Zn-dependent metalloprotease